MPRCQITGKKKSVGHSVSHANNKTKRTFKPNIQKVRALVDGRVVTLKVSTKALRSGLVQKAPRVRKQESQ
ncbi:MAG: 50S ribosomal protein L28 [Candidatus Sumerlaeia bacterium]